MLLPPKSAKRQSFSIDSLAISSHAEDDPGRDTDSPYLNYLEQTRNQPNHSKHHLQKQLPFLEPQIKCANFIFSHQAENQVAFEKFGQSQYRQTLASHPTSTPKETPCKRRRLCSTSTPPSSADDSNEDDKMALDNSIMTNDKLSPASASGSVTSDHEGDSTCSDSSLRRKKLRTAFTGDQLRELEKRYKTQKYLTASDRTHLAKLLGLKDQQVKTWFQNRRMKEKRQQRDDDASQGFCLPTGGVDIAQLAALGVYSPHIGAQLGSPNPINYHFNSPPSPMEPRIPSHPITGSAVSPVQLSPQIAKQSASLSEMYRSGHFLQSAHIAPHLMSSPVHPAYPSAFTSRYSASSYHAQILKGSHQST